MKTGAVYILLIVGLVLYLLFGHNGLIKYRELVTIKNTYERQISQMDNKIEDLRRELELVKKDKEYLELMIRDELNLRDEDEELYLLDENEKIHRNGNN